MSSMAQVRISALSAMRVFAYTVVVIIVVDNWDRVSPAQPPRQIDIGTAARTERLVVFIPGRPANRTPPLIFAGQDNLRDCQTTLNISKLRLP